MSESDFQRIQEFKLNLTNVQLCEILKAHTRFTKADKSQDNSALDEFNRTFQKYGLEFGLGVVGDTGRLDINVMKGKSNGKRA